MEDRFETQSLELEAVQAACHQRVYSLVFAAAISICLFSPNQELEKQKDVGKIAQLEETINNLVRVLLGCCVFSYSGCRVTS